MLWGVAAIGPAVLAGLLLFVAQTGRGTFFAVTALGLLALPFVLLSGRAGGWKAASAAVELGLIAALGLSAPLVPAFHGQEGVSQVEGGGRLSLFAWLPEVDQLALGSFPLMLVDPLLDAAHARHLRDVLPGVHGDLTPYGSPLGSVGDEGSGQMFVIVPPHAEGERLPLVVFLHGSGGSLVAYQALLQRWAVAGHFAVVSPGFGIGNWQNPGGGAAIEAARTFAVGALPIDPTKVALVGLSNGGRGITRLVARDTPRRWPVVIAISAVIEPDLLTETWAGREVLLLHGEADERIGFDVFHLFAAGLEEHGAHVTQRTWPGEDHFLWFSRGPEVQDAALAFLAARWPAPR